MRTCDTRSVRLVLALALAGCYGPVVPTGAPCTTETDCPRELVCDRGHCEREGSEIDASVLIDAPMTIDGNPSCTCASDSTITCNSGPSMTCALGCLMQDDGARCAEITPSNGVVVALVGITTTISIGADTTFDTGTGAITGGVTRAAGSGVSAGIGYEQRLFGNGAQLGVFTFRTLIVAPDATVQLSGPRSAVFVVGTTATISGTISARAGCATDRSCAGPGGGVGATLTVAAGCGPGGNGQSDPNDMTGGDGGGAGGGGGAIGGAGGSAGPWFGGTGGIACLTADNEPLVGGSGGGGGGPGNLDATPPRGGGGGGAFQLTALDRIVVTGTIISGGAGGAGGLGGVTSVANASAGSGGGAGGAILLEAPVVDVAAGSVLAANGGGGGGGGIFSVSGEAGQDGGANAVPAAGGAPASGATRGGLGGAAMTAAGTAGDAPSDRNAGGGGGAVGRIYVRALQPAIAGTVSPPAGTGPLRTH